MKHFLENMIKDNPGFSEYLDEALQKDKIVVSRIVAVASIIMYSLFSVVDYYSIQESLIEVFSIRIFVVLSLIFALISTFNKVFFLKYYGIITASYLTVIGLGIVFMLLFVNENDLAFYTYFAGLSVVIVAGFTWTYLNSTVTFLISLFFILFYIGIFYFSNQGLNSLRISLLINHVAFLTIAVVIGLLADILLKQNLYRQYVMQSRLRELLLSKDSQSLVLDNQDVIESFPNLHQYKNYLNRQIIDAEYSNLLLSVRSLKLLQENKITGKNCQSKSVDWDNMIIGSLIDILPDSKIMAISESNTLYFSYLLKNKDREDMENKTNLIMSLIEKSLNEKYGAKKVIPFIGSVNVFQTKTSAQYLIETCDKNILAKLEQYGGDSIKRLKKSANDNNIASFDKFVKKPVNSDLNQT